MKRNITLGLVSLLLVLSASTIVASAKSDNIAESQVKAEKRNAMHLDLVSKDADWAVIDGAWGKMTYKVDGKFIFNGHELAIEEDYSLINFQRVDGVWPAAVYVLGNGVVNDEGNLHIKGTWDWDEFAVDGSDEDAKEGYKIWLVKTDDLLVVDEADVLNGWNPADYLFEAELIEMP